jgi:UV DNA damage endonuclease
MLNSNFGYACINMQLSYPDKYGIKDTKRVTSNRSMIKKTFIEKGIQYASELGLKNCKDLKSILKWNQNNNFNFFRVTSDLFPWCSEYKIESLPDYDEIKEVLADTGDFILKHKLRITSHPGPFNVLTSPHKHVVDNCIKDLSVHGQLFDLMKLSRTPYNKINIHIGGAYGDKELSMKRFCDNFELLPDSVKSRLTVENDDRASMYSVSDLYNGVYKSINIPLVFDYHHHRFCSGGLSEKDALNLAISTWDSIVPVVHYSESRNIEQKDDTIKPQAHSDYVYSFINTYNNKVDIMIEAKHKELAVRKYLEIFDKN